MGTVYYMAREDGGLQLYELGKVPFWHELLGAREPVHVRGDDLELASRLAAAWRQFDWLPEPLDDAYFGGMVRDLARWSDGKPMRFTGDQDGLIERWQDAHDVPDFPPITGDRYRLSEVAS